MRLLTCVWLISGLLPARAAEPDTVVEAVTAKELHEANRPQPPLRLMAAPGRKDFHLRGDSRELFEEVAPAFGLDVVFDGDYQPMPGLRLRIEDADYREAFRILEAATGSFLVPVSERLVLVANDTPQKRKDLEDTLAVAIPIPDPVSVQEAQELARSVQQLMEIQRLAVDSQQRIVLMRGEVSKLRPAQRIIEQLLHRQPEIAMEVEFLEVIENSNLSYGLRLQSSFPLVWLSRIWNSTPSMPVGLTRLATFGGGKSFFGLGLADAELFASMARSCSHTLMKTEIRSINGQEATFHVGDKFPVLTSGFFGPIEGPGEVYRPPPTFNFVDLGVVVKVTPHVHGTDEVTLEVEAEFKVLAGESLNGIPVIANRSFQAVTRVRHGEWAVLAGLVRTSEARSLSGPAGLSQLRLLGPLFRQNDRDRESGQTLLILKPRLLSLPPTELVTRPVWTGTETRPRTQL